MILIALFVTLLFAGKGLSTIRTITRRLSTATTEAGDVIIIIITFIVVIYIYMHLYNYVYVTLTTAIAATIVLCILTVTIHILLHVEPVSGSSCRVIFASDRILGSAP